MKLRMFRPAPRLHKAFLEKPKVTVQHKHIDIGFLIAVVILAVFGLLMVYDSSQFEAFQEFNDNFYYIKQQVISAVIGFGLLGFFSFYDYRRLQKIALPFFLLSILLLLLVFIPGLGVKAGGAHRWIRLAGFPLQPAEIIKLSSVIFLAAIFQKKVRSLPFILMTGFIGLIIGVFQRDLGSAVVFFLIAFGIYFVAGAQFKNFLGLLVVGALGLVGFVLIAPYRIKRILAFLDPFADPQGYTYHISQILIALGSGGLFGLGGGQSRQKFAYIPEITTDSIFSVIGEEFGLLGSIVLISLIGFLVLRGYKIAQASDDKFGKLLAVGLTTWLGVQAAVNLASMVSLMPLTGVPLPFISYGGSALIANLVAVGILLNISKHNITN